MDDLTAALASSFQVGNNSLTTDAPHPKFSELYKNRGRMRGQEERRRRMLELQKQKRFDLKSHVRRLANNDWNDFEDEDTNDQDDSQMDCEASLPRPGRRYKNQLMLSEWMMEVPENFEEDWLMVACPVGKRALVVASRGKTYSYTKSGYCANTFPSHLPGGNRRQSGSSSMATESTILDCIYSEKDGTYYVLDIMCWNGHPVLDSETEFRFFWTHSKFQDCPAAATKSPINPFKFLPLPSCPCSQDAISKVLNTDLGYELDGLLYYHRQTHYLFGSTPLVLWLKAYMIPEVLGVKVHSKYMTDIPSSYTCFGSHVEKVKKDKEEHDDAKGKRESRVRKNKTETETMDSEVIQTESNSGMES